MIPAFVFFPPEINSALIVGGPGAGPLYEAASAWDGLAANLSSSASSFHTVVSDLAGGAWTGPSSVSMTAAAAPYVEWLIIAAAQAEVAALQARMAALAYEGALVATVPLPEVLANRARLLVLIATNFLGVNTAAIAQTELEYVEMWAQDVAAMLGYHAGAQSMAQSLPAFSAPPAALGGGASSAGLAGSATAPLSFASQFFDGLSSLGAAFASELQSVFSALAPAVSSLTSVLSSTPVAALTTVAPAGMYPATALMTPMATLAQSAGPAAAPAAAPSVAPALVGAAGPPGNAPHSAGSALSDLQPLAGGGLGAFGIATAGLGSARFVGSMSVPAAWQGSVPAYIGTPAMSAVGSGAPAATAAAEAVGSGSGAPMTAMPVSDKSPEGEDRGTRAQVVRSRPKVMPRNRPG